MKAEELMIGDWVLAGKMMSRIESINKQTVELCSVDGIYGVFEVECVQPIPLTEEILEKNGFEIDPESGWNIWVSDEDEEISYRGTILEIVSPFTGNLQFVTCKYVHELQHALKLFGIEKSIEL